MAEVALFSVSNPLASGESRALQVHLRHGARIRARILHTDLALVLPATLLMPMSASLTVPYAPGDPRRLDPKLVHVFVTVVRAGGLSPATLELQTDLSTVSRQFKELESRVGKRLASRGRAGFRLTADGEALLGMAQRWLDAQARFQVELDALRTPPPAVLRIGVVDALLTALPGRATHLAHGIRHCSEACPGIAFSLSTLRPVEIERRLLSSELDAGIVAAHTPPAGLEQHTLYSEPNSLFVAPGHPWYETAGRERTDTELAGLACVVDPYASDLPVPGLSTLLLHGHTRADSIEGVALLVCSGRFAGFLPDHLVASTGPLSGLRRVWPERLSHTQDIVLTCRKGKASAPLRSLLRALAPPT